MQLLQGVAKRDHRRKCMITTCKLVHLRETQSKHVRELCTDRIKRTQMNMHMHMLGVNTRARMTSTAHTFKNRDTPCRQLQMHLQVQTRQMHISNGAAYLHVPLPLALLVPCWTMLILPGSMTAIADHDISLKAHTMRSSHPLRFLACFFFLFLFSINTAGHSNDPWGRTRMCTFFCSPQHCLSCSFDFLENRSAGCWLI